MTGILMRTLTDDGTLKDDSALKKYYDMLLDAANKIGQTGKSVEQYKSQLADAGFKNIVETKYKWPTNSWPKDPKAKELGKSSYSNLFLEVIGD